MFNFDLNAYKEDSEAYYSTGYYENIKHNLQIGDVVKIKKDILSNKGYKNQIGIIEGLSGVDEYVYVLAYCDTAKRYWACGFDECELIKLELCLKDTNFELRQEYFSWLKRNRSQFVLNYYKGKPPYNNVIYIDFN